MPPTPPPTIAISLGDPRGIGPEITHAALKDPAISSRARFLLFDGLPQPTHSAGKQSFDAVMQAIEAVKSGRASALVTAPIAKDAWHAAGITKYPGHTELLAEQFNSPRSAMLFLGPTLRVILVTIHIPLRDIPKTITAEKVFDAIDLGHKACLDLGIKSPRIAVAGLNPHAGEGGLFGDEDDRLIAPAIQRAQAAGINATGPLPGDTVFLKAAQKQFDLVVAMYHDQGLIPVKLLDRNHTVNVTTGLTWNGKKVIRTSPAHGTALDIAHQGLADATSMKAAITLAIDMATKTI